MPGPAGTEPESELLFGALGAVGKGRMSVSAHSARGRLVASRTKKLLRPLSRREEPPRQGKHVAVPSAIPGGLCLQRDGSMPGAIRRTAQVLSPGGGIEGGAADRTRRFLLGWVSVPDFRGPQADGGEAVDVVAGVATGV